MELIYNETFQLTALVLVNLLIFGALYHFLLRYLSSFKGYAASFILVSALLMSDVFAYNVSATVRQLESVVIGSEQYVSHCFTLLGDKETAINKKAVLFHLLNNFQNNELKITINEEAILKTEKEAISITRPSRQMSIKQYAYQVLENQLNEKVEIKVLEKDVNGKISRLEISKTTVY